MCCRLIGGAAWAPLCFGPRSNGDNNSTASELELSVLPHNPARRLYQALGFTMFGLEMRKDMTSVS